MSKDPRLIEVKDGLLRLHGVANEDRAKDSSAYLTGGVTSQGKFDFKNGRLEMRAGFKSAKGAWPAIWLLPTGMQWPKGGEIDVMEHLNFEDKVYQTIHTPYTIEAKKNANPDDNVRTTLIKRDDFNTYGMEWNDNAVVFLVNGTKSFTYKRDAAKGEAQWPFVHPMYLILSMQIGGSWVGETDPAHYPAYLEIDWVRVYSAK
jgi:beta-glucanase (GH16 family)